MIAGIIVIALLACDSTSNVFNDDLDVLGTSARIVVVGLPDEEAAKVAREVEEELRKLDHIGYTFEGGGELQKLNEAIARGQTTTVSAELRALIVEAGRLYTASKGLFNPAAGELTALWENACPHTDCTESPYIWELRKFIDPKVDEVILKKQPSMEDLSIDGDTVTSRKPVVRLEFGDMIRGFALDRGITRLKELGVENAMIFLGNGVRTIGSRGSKPWWIGLPILAESKHLIGTIQSSGDEAVVTVYAFDKSIAKEGAIYRHVVDSRSGLPVRETKSVTVIHKSATTANAAAAALLIVGRDEWSSVAGAMGVRDVVMVTRDGTVYNSQEMDERIHWKKDLLHLHLVP